MDFTSIQRAELLLEQKRAPEAEKILLSVHGEMADSAQVKYLLSECRFQQNDYKEALRYIDEAIGLFPESAYYYAHKANVLLNDNKVKDAFQNIEHAIYLDPEESYFWSIKAVLLYDDRKYEEALAAANGGLASDPEDSVCLNIRSLSLAKLNRVDEAGETIKDALKSNPNDSFTYASQGFISLQEGKSREALELFREALRINPGSSYAKSGLVEALKSRFFIYRWFYQFFDWMGRQGSSIQWALIIGIIVVQHLSSSIAKTYPDLAPVFNVVSILLVVFVLLSWIIVPLSNLLLRLSPYGRYALTKNQIESSNWIGVLLLVSLLLFIGTWITQIDVFEPFALMVLLSVIPVSYIFYFRSSPQSTLVNALSIGIIVLGFLSIILDFFNIFLFLFLGYQFYINSLGMKRSIE